MAGWLIPRGTNLLAEFGSVVDAVQCAVAVQKDIQTRNAVAELLRRKPGFSCRYAEEHLFYLESPQIEHYFKGLSLAGVPG